jgi:hypothetical protein
MANLIVTLAGIPHLSRLGKSARSPNRRRNASKAGIRTDPNSAFHDWYLRAQSAKTEVKLARNRQTQGICQKSLPNRPPRPVAALYRRQTDWRYSQHSLVRWRHPLSARWQPIVYYTRAHPCNKGSARPYFQNCTKNRHGRGRTADDSFLLHLSAGRPRP